MSLPVGFVDVSGVRDVPDNQEVFTQVETDRTIIIELLKHDPAVTDSECGAFHFAELARENQSTRSRVTVTSEVEAGNMPNLEHVSHRAFVRGTQWIAKFRERDANEVDVFLAVLRMPDVGTDVVVSLCSPISIAPTSSSATTTTSRVSESVLATDFGTLLSTLKVNDWKLFDA